MTVPIIKTATASDEAHVIDALALAFVADPATRWVRPDPQKYLLHFPSFVKAFGGKTFARGSAYYIDGYAGAALWLPPDVHTDVETVWLPYCKVLDLNRLKRMPWEYLSRWAVISQVSRIGIFPFLGWTRSNMAKDMAQP